MNRVYDAFEVLPDGTLMWKATVTGHEDAVKKLEQLAKDNPNEFRLMRIPSKTVIATINCQNGAHHPTLLQFRVFGLGFLQDRNIGIGVLPQREEALIRRAGFRLVPEH